MGQEKECGRETFIYKFQSMPTIVFEGKHTSERDTEEIVLANTRVLYREPPGL